LFFSSYLSWFYYYILFQVVVVMVEFIALLLFLVLVNVLFSWLKRRSEQHRSGWKAHLEDNRPRQAGARKKVG
jgi:uncharacterized membrane protein YjgN (DUF898 family)